MSIASSLAICSSALAADDSLTISYWGGNSAETFKKNVVAPFEEEFGVTVTLETGRSSERLSKLIATKGRGVDLFYITDNQMIKARDKGLLQGVPEADLPNMGDLYEFARDPLGIGNCPSYTVLASGLAYNKTLFGSAPDSWNALQDGSQTGGSVGIPDLGTSTGPMVLIALSEANGGGIDNVDPGFEALASNRDGFHFFSRSSATMQMISQGDVAIAPMLNIFVKKNPDADVQISFPAEGAIGVPNMACVVNGADSAELAAKFINHHLSAEIQTVMMNNAGETPTRMDVVVTDDVPFNALKPEDIAKLKFWDLGTIAGSRETWLSRFQEEVAAQ